MEEALVSTSIVLALGLGACLFYLNKAYQGKEALLERPIIASYVAVNHGQGYDLKGLVAIGPSQIQRCSP